MMHDVHNEILQLVICEDQRFDIFDHELERFQEKRRVSKNSMPKLFMHEEQVEVFLVDHQPEYVFHVFEDPIVDYMEFYFS